MQILVDADACPVVRQVESVARRHQVPVVLLCDTNHVLQSNYSDVKIIGAGKDAVDIALVNLCHAGDIVVTQDYGLAAMALGKRAHALHWRGWRYTNENIDRLLAERHIMKKLRRILPYGKQMRGMSIRMDEDDKSFYHRLNDMVTQYLEEEKHMNSVVGGLSCGGGD